MKVTFKQLSEDTLLIEWPDEPNEQTLNEILSYENAIETNISEGIVECYPAYRSLAVSFDATCLPSSELIERISNLSINNIPVKSTLWRLPVCYDQAVGADLINFAGMKSMSQAQLTEIHCSATYRVHFFGFLPGFMYLSGLDSRLYHPPKRHTGQTHSTWVCSYRRNSNRDLPNDISWWMACYWQLPHSPV
jgi:inhibitor of KinA